MLLALIINYVLLNKMRNAFALLTLSHNLSCYFHLLDSVVNCIVLYCIYSSSALLIKTKKSKIYMQDCNKTANAETSGLMGNPIIGLKSITSGDRFMSPRTKLKS